MSVRGERVVYRERDREDDWQPEKRSYTTVKRYQVPDRSFDEDVVQTDKIMVRRERREDPPPRTEVSYRGSDRDIRERGHREESEYRVTERVTEREREREIPQRRDISYRVLERDDHDRHSHSDSRSEFRFVERERETVRAPPPPVEERVREYRFERERSYSPPRREREREPEVERYVRSTEYYQQPQPIIIRESAAPQPIIIERERREPQPIVIRREEPQYEVIERDEVREERMSMVRREDPPAPATVVSKAPSRALTVQNKANDEDYFYERRIREVERAPRDDIRPRDSASQASSDDSYEYIRRERVIEGERERSRSSHRKRDLAAGALAGVAGAEILRSHRQKEGKDVGGRGRSIIGGAAVGAIGAEAVRRAKSFRKDSRSRSRSRSSSYESRRHRKHRSKSRERSKSRVRQYGGMAAVAAAGALAGYALMKNKGNKGETIIVKEGNDRRSRSRRRPASRDTGYLSGSSFRSRSRSQSALNPENRNKRIAQAGALSAAAAGIYNHVRSKSRGGGKSRSRSRIQQGAPIAVAGLGGAALAGLYEKNKANKEAKKAAIIETTRSPDLTVEGIRGDTQEVTRAEAVQTTGADTLAEVAAEEFLVRKLLGLPALLHWVRMSLAYPFVISSTGNTNTYLGRSDDYTDTTFSDYDHPSGYIAPRHSDAGYNRQGGQSSYPGGMQFPPPPNAAQADPAYANAHADPFATNRDSTAAAQNYSPYPAYNPADYPPTGTTHPYEQTRGVYGESDATLGAPYPGQDTFAGDSRFAAPEDAAAQREREHEIREDAAAEEARRHGRDRDPGNVSGSPVHSFEPAQQQGMEAAAVGGVGGGGGEDQDADGVITPRARSTSRVRFDLGSNIAISPEATRRTGTSSDDRSFRSRERRHRRDADNEDSPDRHRHHRKTRPDSDGARDSPSLFGDKYDDPPHEDDSDSTVEMPARFDERGQRKPEGSGNELAESIQALLSGRGGAGDLLKGIMGAGGGEGESDGGSGRSGRRRRRRAE
ncbi:hypothetical protein B0A48_09363 [Cryoendolithus antarcticus]|uniref:DUF3824 domain-containing protein n=1 Tax=Cryoendolithus antarcticus TaxID=1507870 RepID=A0A1V8SZK2_9PEZI|nr:hypothetical protein B0A48_09363 [Cryoendolithus antarcticus]